MSSYQDSDYFCNKPDDKIPASLSLDELISAKPYIYHQSLEDYHPTPLVQLNELSNSLGLGSVYIKDESQRFGLNAFKALGASYAVHRAIESNPEIKVFCSATDGNHGHALAWAAGKAGRKSIIYVPKGTSQARISAIINEGARVEVADGNYDFSCRLASEKSYKSGWQLIQDTAWPDYEEVPARIMAGYTTMFYEIDAKFKKDSLPFFDYIFLQAGVGSFAASAAWYYMHHYSHMRPKIIIVEPTESDGIFESFKRKAPAIPPGNQNSVMAGLNCGIPSSSAWEILKHLADLSIRISDTEAIRAMRKLYYPEGDDRRIISGESGAAGLAGLIKLITIPSFEEARLHLGLSADSKVLIINTEGATDPDSFLRNIDIEI